MALAVDSVEAGGTGHNSATSPLTFNFTNTAGNLILLKLQLTETSGGAAVSFGAVSYGGDALTLISGASQAWDTNASLCAIYALANPKTGSNQFSVAFTAATGADCMAEAISFSGAAGTFGTAFKATATAATATVDVTGTTSGNYVVAAVGAGSALNANPVQGTKNALQNVSGFTAGDNGGSWYIAAPGGTQTMSWGITASDLYGIVAVEVFSQALTLSISGASGVASAGFINLPNSAILDFGAFPGASDAAVIVQGQSTIGSGSIVEAWIRPVATPDHTADEHLVEPIKVFANSIVAGTGFTISGFNTNELIEPVEPVRTGPHTDGGLQKVLANGGGTGTRIYGAWTVSWAWI